MSLFSNLDAPDHSSTAAQKLASRQVLLLRKLQEGPGIKEPRLFQLSFCLAEGRFSFGPVGSRQFLRNLAISMRFSQEGA